MPTKKILFFTLLITATVFLLEQCKHLPSEEVIPYVVNPNGNNPTPSTHDTLCFSSDILPLVISTCAKPTCHDAISHVEGLNLTNYANIMQGIVPGNPNQSAIYYYCLHGGNMRTYSQSLTVLDTASLNKLAKWINAGAINSICNNCDTVNVKFSTHIFPIIQQNCLGCHTAGTTTLLNNYTQVLAQVNNGQLYCAVSHCGTYNPMPQGGSKLDACKIRAIKIWIDAGSPNN